MDSQRKAWNEAMRNAAGSSLSSARRSSNRQKKQSRRDKSRKSVSEASSSLENREYRMATRIDALEGIVELGEELEEEYDEFDDETAGSKRKRSKRGNPKNHAVSKRLKARSLASILMEDAGRADGVTTEYLQAEAKPKAHGRYPPRKFCPVTGLFGIYTDPKTGIPYANLTALEQIRERAPPWMNYGGSAAYSEAVKSLRNEE